MTNFPDQKEVDETRKWWRGFIAEVLAVMGCVLLSIVLSVVVMIYLGRAGF